MSTVNRKPRCLAENPQLDMALARLKDGRPESNDFHVVMGHFNSFSAAADTQAIEMTGDLADIAKGAARCWREIVRMIDAADGKPVLVEHAKTGGSDAGIF